MDSVNFAKWGTLFKNLLYSFKHELTMKLSGLRLVLVFCDASFSVFLVLMNRCCLCLWEAGRKAHGFIKALK